MLLAFVLLSSVTHLCGEIVGSWDDKNLSVLDSSDLNDAIVTGNLEKFKALFSDAKIRGEFITFKSGGVAVKAVRTAAVKGYLDIVKCLLNNQEIREKFRSCQGGGYAPETAFKAAKKGHFEVFKYLFESIIVCTLTQLKLASGYATNIGIKNIFQAQIEMQELIEQFGKIKIN